MRRIGLFIATAASIGFVATSNAQVGSSPSERQEVVNIGGRYFEAEFVRCLAMQGYFYDRFQNQWQPLPPYVTRQSEANSCPTRTVK